MGSARKHVAAVVAVSITITIIMGGASPAGAISANIQIANTGGDGVNMRSGPGTAHGKVGWIPEGASPDYNCYVWGERVNNVPIWFNVNWNGVTGFYSSYFDNSSYQSDAELQSKYGIPKCGESAPAPPPAPAPQPPPGGGLEYTVFQADGGVFYRNSPRWDDTPRTPGVGVYNGDRVRLICGAIGDAVGPYSNNWWSYVTNLSRNVGNGWVNHHYIDDGMAADQPPAGEPGCGPDTPGTGSAPPAPAPAPGQPSPTRPANYSVFFSPNATGTGLPGLAGAELNVAFPLWTGGNACYATNAVQFVEAGTQTLSGWSAGRMGPMYVLAAGSKAIRSQLRTIVLFDPGSRKNFREGCEGQSTLNPNALLDAWLRDPAHRLIVVTGEDSKKDSYAGLWEYYFAGIWRSEPGSRAMVCDYDGMNHKDVLRKLNGLARNPGSKCPRVGGYDLTTWYPGSRGSRARTLHRRAMRIIK
jgi:uncharacterized protein YraI